MVGGSLARSGTALEELASLVVHRRHRSHQELAPLRASERATATLSLMDRRTRCQFAPRDFQKPMVDLLAQAIVSTPVLE